MSLTLNHLVQSPLGETRILGRHLPSDRPPILVPQVALDDPVVVLEHRGDPSVDVRPLNV